MKRIRTKILKSKQLVEASSFQGSYVFKTWPNKNKQNMTCLMNMFSILSIAVASIIQIIVTVTNSLNVPSFFYGHGSKCSLQYSNLFTLNRFAIWIGYFITNCIIHLGRREKPYDRGKIAADKPMSLNQTSNSKSRLRETSREHPGKALAHALLGDFIVRTVSGETPGERMEQKEFIRLA